MRYVDGAASDDQKSSSFERNFNRSSSTGGEDKLTGRKEITRTQALDRTNDAVYTATTNVVKAIMSLSQGVEKAAAIEYLDLVRNVGIELRALLSSVDTLASIFPPQAHKWVLSSQYSRSGDGLTLIGRFRFFQFYREVEMAHKVLAKDMSELVSTMRLAQQYSETTLDVEYRK